MFFSLFVRLVLHSRSLCVPYLIMTYSLSSLLTLYLLIYSLSLCLSSFLLELEFFGLNKTNREKERDRGFCRKEEILGFSSSEVVSNDLTTMTLIQDKRLKKMLRLL
jgi:hypothetical protein